MSGRDSSDDDALAGRIFEDLTEHERSRGQPAASPAETLPDLPRYEVRERLGEGVTAVVYHAWDRELKREVALKVLRESSALSDVARVRFRREAQAAAGLVHPNVVTVHDAGEAGGRLYIVMELLEGRSLKELLKDGNATQKARIQLIEKAARGVAAAHEKGIVHRDLKPANILVTAGGEPKVGDFGLVHLVDSDSEVTRAGTPLGTPLYMSPEQVEGNLKEQTPRTDVYALGAILYEALTGTAPHDAETIPELYRKIVEREPRMPRALNPKISRDLETVILQALDKDPARRYPTAAAFADDLASILEGEPIRARRAGVGHRLLRRLRKNPIAVGIGAVAVVGILGLWGKVRSERDATVPMMRETARLSLAAALQLREKGDLEGMRRHLPALEEAYRGARERAPQLAEIDYLLGRMHRALMDTEKALACQEEALRKDPDFGPALYERAVLRSKKDQPVVADLTRLLSRERRETVVGFSDVSLLAARGMLAHAQGRESEARDLLEQALKKDPHLDEAWETLAQVTIGQAERERSFREREKVFTEAILKDRGYVPHLLGRGDLRRDRGGEREARGESPLLDMQSAEEDYSEAIRLNRESQEAWLRRAQVRTQRGMFLANRNQDPLPDYAAAEADVAALSKLAPKAEKPVIWRSVVSVLRGTWLASRGKDPLPEYARAVEEATEGLRLLPESEDGYKRRGIAHLHRAMEVADPAEDFRRAAADLAQARVLAPNTADLRMWQGILELRRGNVAAGEALLTEAVELKPDYARAWMWRGVARRGRDREGALKDLTRSIELNLGLTEAWFWRGVVAGSEEDLTHALTLDPGYAEAWQARGTLRSERKAFAAAAEDQQAALRINPRLKK